MIQIETCKKSRACTICNKSNFMDYIKEDSTQYPIHEISIGTQYSTQTIALCSDCMYELVESINKFAGM